MSDESTKPLRSDWIALNVGGHRVVTTRETLRADPDSMLSRLFARDSPFGVTQDESGCVLLDRDWKLFQPILLFLRTRRCVVPVDVEIRDVLEEAKYFQLQPLIDELSARLQCDLKRTQLVKLIALSAASRGPLKSPPEAVRPHGVMLAGVRLRRLDARALNLANANMSRTWLTEAHFDRADLSTADVSEAQGWGVSFAGADIRDATVALSSFDESNFEQAQMCRTNAWRLRSRKSSFKGANCEHANFQHAILTDCDFREANVTGTKFQRAVLRNCDFRGATLHDSHFGLADLRGARFDWEKLLPELDGSASEPTDDQFATRGVLLYSVFGRARVSREQLKSIPESFARKMQLVCVDEDKELFSDSIVREDGSISHDKVALDTYDHTHLRAWTDETVGEE